jgi:hypothetical protein
MVRVSVVPEEWYGHIRHNQGILGEYHCLLPWRLGCYDCAPDLDDRDMRSDRTETICDTLESWFEGREERTGRIGSV